MLEAFHEGGFGMYPTLVFGALLLAVSIRYAITPVRRLVPLLVSLNVLTIAAGWLGFVTGFIKSVRAIAEGGAERPVLGLLGAGEAANCVALALVMIVIGALATSTGAFRLSRQPEPAT